MAFDVREDRSTALLAGVAARLEERDRLDWERVNELPVPRNVDQLVDGLSVYVSHCVDADRVRTSARYALMLETALSDAVAGPLRRAREALVVWAVGLFSEIDGATESDCQVLMDYAEGVILHQLSMPVEYFDPRPGLARLAAALFV